MPQIYEEADPVKELANRLIGTYHPELATAKIRYLFKEKASKKGGRVVHGTVKKMSDLMNYLIDVDFLVEVPIDLWNELENQKRVALVDHLLERCTGEEDEQTAEMKWSVREPDVNEFSSILRRHGAWTEELSGFVSVAKTLDLGFMTESEEENQLISNV
jgi:hypothetical protein